MIYSLALAESKQLKKEISNIRKQLKSYPKGKLSCSKNGNNYKWYQCFGRGKAKYIHKSEKSFAEKLAIKTYLSLRLEELLSEQSAINFYLRHHKVSPAKSEQLLTEHPEFQKLLSPYFKPLSTELEDWMCEPYQKNTAFSASLRIKAPNGILVRSKSEQLIATILYKYRIPFRYECALDLGGNVIYPDFTIRHPKTGEFFYLEHFGRMDDLSYSKNVAPKLSQYIAHGIIPSINLLTTYETLEHPLNYDTVDNLVKQYFL